MRNKIVCAALCALLVPALLASMQGCREERFVMTATVTALGEELLVEVISGEYAEGPFWIVLSELTRIVDEDGRLVTREAIAVGDTLRITYNGQMMMSYPPKVAARKIEIL